MNMLIFATSEDLILTFDQTRPSAWFTDITAICDTDNDGKLYCLEIFLYEERSINYEVIQQQISKYHNVTGNEYGLIYLRLREGIFQRGPGFGRGAKVGLNKNGLLSVIKIPWNSPGAEIPFVDPIIALNGLVYEMRVPHFIE